MNKKAIEESLRAYKCHLSDISYAVANIAQDIDLLLEEIERGGTTDECTIIDDELDSSDCDKLQECAGTDGC